MPLAAKQWPVIFVLHALSSFSDPMPPLATLLRCRAGEAASGAARLALLALLLAACDATEVGIAQSSQTVPAPEADAFAGRVTVEPAPEWTALFDRAHGWTGADGIYSIPLGGVDAAGSAERTAFVFSDTFIGDVNADGTRAGGSLLVNNTVALLDGAAPDPDRIAFFWRRDGGRPRAVFVPETPLAEPGDYYWLGDGFVNPALGGATHLFALRVRSAGGSFEVVGGAFLTLPPGSRPPFDDAVQVDLPFYRPAQNGRGPMSWGSGVFVNTAAAGAPDPDGYVYIYGVEEPPFIKRLLAARVRPEDVLDFSRWRFFDGTGWSPDVEDAARLASRISNELSVTPLPDAGYALVFQLDTLGRDVAGRTAPTPVGPFGPVQPLYRTPEPDLLDDVFTYNAKAHPHLSAPGTLLISYNVNTFNFLDHFAYADIYRPRFVRLRF